MKLFGNLFRRRASYNTAAYHSPYVNNVLRTAFSAPSFDASQYSFSSDAMMGKYKLVISRDDKEKADFLKELQAALQEDKISRVMAGKMAEGLGYSPKHDLQVNRPKAGLFSRLRVAFSVLTGRVQVGAPP